MSSSFVPVPPQGQHFSISHDTPYAANVKGTKVPFHVGQTEGSGVGQVLQTRARRGVAETSAEAFHSLPVAGYLAPKEAAVLRLFAPGVKLSRQQISAALPMPINGVCGRVDSLLAGGHLQECGDRIDPLTRKRQKLLQLPRADQGSLLGGAR